MESTFSIIYFLEWLEQNLLKSSKYSKYKYIVWEMYEVLEMYVVLDGIMGRRRTSRLPGN